MKSQTTLFCTLIGFLFGVGFYHNVLLRGQFPNLNLNHQSSKLHLTSVAQAQINAFSKQRTTPTEEPCVGGIPLEEVVKGPLAQDDPRLLTLIRQNYIFPPSPDGQPYNLTLYPRASDTSMGQAKMVLRALNYARGGWFVECGALDGELRSNTLMLERRFGWSGLLIEGDPKNFALLQHKHRKAWSSQACLATTSHPQQVLFEQAFNRGKITVQQPIQSEPIIRKNDNPQKIKAPPKRRHEDTKTTTLVQCFPLFSLLSALNITEVDYFSLDVEGAEIAVLEHVPFDKIRIKVLSVEYLHSPGGRESLRKFMTGKGYAIYGEVRDPVHNWANDLIFIHNSLVS